MQKFPPSQLGTLPNPQLMMGHTNGSAIPNLIFPGPGGLPTNTMAAMMGLPGASDPAMMAAMSSMLGSTNFMQPGPPVQAAAEAAATPTHPQSLWKEHRTAEGRVFWHNTKTNKSTWDKPDELRTDLERVLATSTSWREYPSGEDDDRTYWHHLETKASEWEQPKEVAEIMAKMQALEAEDWTDKKFDGKLSAKAEFRSFLEKRGVGYKGKWEDVGKILQSDPKWKVFDQFLTTGERKHLFNEVVNQLQKKTREEQRVRKAAARDSLAEFLAKWRAEKDSPMPPDVDYETFEEKAASEPWFHILDPTDKAEALEECAQQIADEALQQRPARQKQDDLALFFADLEPEELPLKCPASEVVNLVKKSFDDQWLIGVHPSLILNIWQRHVRMVIGHQRQQVKKSLFREERVVRAAFRKLLQDAEEEGLLDAKSEWRDFVSGVSPKRLRLAEECKISNLRADAEDILCKVQVKVREWMSTPPDKHGTSPQEPAVQQSEVATGPPRVCEDRRYLRLFLQGGSTARELFEDFVYELWDVYEAVRPLIKNSLVPSSPLGDALVNCDTSPLSLDEFESLTKNDPNIKIPQDLWNRANRRGVLDPLIVSLGKRLRRACADPPASSAQQAAAADSAQQSKDD